MPTPRARLSSWRRVTDSDGTVASGVRSGEATLGGSDAMQAGLHAYGTADIMCTLYALCCKVILRMI